MHVNFQVVHQSLSFAAAPVVLLRPCVRVLAFASNFACLRLQLEVSLSRFGILPKIFASAYSDGSALVQRSVDEAADDDDFAWAQACLSRAVELEGVCFPIRAEFAMCVFVQYTQAARLGSRAQRGLLLHRDPYTPARLFAATLAVGPLHYVTVWLLAQQKKRAQACGLL